MVRRAVHRPWARAGGRRQREPPRVVDPVRAVLEARCPPKEHAETSRTIRGVDRFPPRLGPRRRGVRRTARRGLLARSDRPAQGARGRPAPADRRSVRSPRRKGLASGSPASDPGWPQERRPPKRPQSCATGTAYPFSTRWPTPAWNPPWARAPWLDRIDTFVELHVEQGRDLVDRDAPVGLATGIWPHGRYRFDFTGDANHAGTTRMEDRHDPMLTYAITALAANKHAGVAGQRATFGRLEVAPNGTNAIPSRVTAWLDARCQSETELVRLVAEIKRQAIGASRSRRHAGAGDRRVGVRGRLLRPRPDPEDPGAGWPIAGARCRSSRRWPATTPASSRLPGCPRR